MLKALSVQRRKIRMSGKEPMAFHAAENRKPRRNALNIFALDDLIGLYAVANHHDVACARRHDIAELGADALLGE